jgi:GNAT superfamily N-acetyltransferase
VVLLARLAVDEPSQGIGLGEALLLDALQRGLDLSQKLGIHAVEVHALDEAAASFSSKYGFSPLIDHPLHLYLPIATLKHLLQ